MRLATDETALWRVGPETSKEPVLLENPWRLASHNVANAGRLRVQRRAHDDAEIRMHFDRYALAFRVSHKEWNCGRAVFDELRFKNPQCRCLTMPHCYALRAAAIVSTIVRE